MCSDAGYHDDSELVKQANAEHDYWRVVPQRVVKTIRYISDRGLPFRGLSEIFGSPRNGHYLDASNCWPYSNHFLPSTSNLPQTKDRVTLLICPRQFMMNLSIC